MSKAFTDLVGRLVSKQSSYIGGNLSKKFIQYRLNLKIFTKLIFYDCTWMNRSKSVNGYGVCVCNKRSKTLRQTQDIDRQY